jgi:hypothetical protein
MQGKHENNVEAGRGAGFENKKIIDTILHL